MVVYFTSGHVPLAVTRGLEDVVFCGLKRGAQEGEMLLSGTYPVSAIIVPSPVAYLGGGGWKKLFHVGSQASHAVPMPLLCTIPDW